MENNRYRLKEDKYIAGKKVANKNDTCIIINQSFGNPCDVCTVKMEKNDMLLPIGIDFLTPII
jgi:hypothetical protein